MIEAGQNYPWTMQVKDASGALTNVTTITLTVTAPDGTVSTPAVQNPPDVTGTYVCNVPLPIPGLYKLSPVTSLGTPATDYVNARQFLSLLSLAEAKTHLNITTTTNDDELRNFMQASCELIEAKAGICVQRQFTDRVTEGAYELAVPHRPLLSVVSITSVWTGGPSWTGAQLRIDTEAGLIAQLVPFIFWWGPWDVTYVAGRAIIPERFIHAAKEQLRHLWETQRGSMPPALLQGEEVFTTTAGWSFSVPRRVLELLEEDMDPVI